MIYLTDTTEPQAAFVPRNDAVPDGNLVFSLRSTVDKDRLTVTQVTTAGYKHIYFLLYITLPEGMTPGEYEYTLEDGEHNLISKGLAIVGNYSTERTTYNNDITYEQYTTE